VSAPQHPLVELAHDALALLAKVDRFGDETKAKNSAAEIHKAWVRAPLSVAIGGPISARTELINYLCDRKVLDPANRPESAAGLRIRRGKATKFKAIRDDKSTEEHVLPAEQADDDALRMRAQSAKTEVDERKLALQRVEKALPRGARARPRGFMIFLWPLWWLLTRRHRRALADRSLTEHAYDQACDALKLAEEELATSAKRIRIERTRFFESLRALSSGPPLGTNVRIVDLVLGEGPLPPGVDLIEMVRPKMNEQVDAVLLVERDSFYAPVDEGGDAPEIGSIAEVVPNLLAVLGRSRALVLARRARDELEPAVGALDDEIQDTEEGFRLRIERLEAMQIVDREEFASEALGKTKTQVTPGIRIVMERAAVHLAHELDRLNAEWTHAISIAQDNDQLKSAVARIEQSAPVDAKRIGDEVRSVAMDAAARLVADVLPDLLATLKPHGLEERPPKGLPQLPPVEMLPSMINPASTKKLSGFLTGLFKSFESRRADVQTKAEQRIASLREIGASEILSAEPKLRDVVDKSLHEQLHAAIDRQIKWLDKTMITEREAVAADGIALAPLSRMRDRLKADLAKLVEGIEQLDKENPGLAAAAGATSSA
jgi:hypothetical protein